MKGPPGCPPRGVPFAAVALVVAYMLSPIFCIWFLLTPNISVLDTQALLRRVDDFMPADEFARIQACLRDHPLTGRTLLSDEGFSKTKGFVIGFNKEGVQTFKDDVRFECLHSYFDRAAYEGANAFVMNLLVCHLPTNESDVVVDLHIDNTLHSWYPGIMFAHQVNVLYLNVPHDIKGGQLQLFRYRADGSDPRHDSTGKMLPRDEVIRLSPDGFVEPNENTMVALFKHRMSTC